MCCCSYAIEKNVFPIEALLCTIEQHAITADPMLGTQLLPKLKAN